MPVEQCPLHSFSVIAHVLHALWRFVLSADHYAAGVEDAAADFDMGTLHLVVERFTNVVQKCARTCNGWVCANLLGYHASNMRHLN